MGFNRKSLTSLLLSILAVVSALALYTYGNSVVNQILILTHFGILVVLGFLNDIFTDKTVLVILFINFASLIITLAYHSSFGVTIIFLNLIIACFIFNNIQVEKNTFMFIRLVPAVLWTIIVIFSVHGEYLQPNGEMFHYLFIGNALQKNTMGIICLGCIFHYIAIIEVSRFRRITKVIISLIVILLFSFKLSEAHCRSALFSLILFVILYLSVNKSISYKYFYCIVLIGIICTGLFTLYYVGNVVELNLGDVMGTSSFNRLGTWEAAFDLIERYPIFGSGTDIKMLKYDSAHNTVLSILKTIGIIPTLSYALCFAKRIKKGYKIEYNRINQIAVISLLIVTAFESFYVESYIYMTFLIMLISPVSSLLDFERLENINNASKK